MIAIDTKQGLATEVGEYWGAESEEPEPVIVTISINEENSSVEFSYAFPHGSGSVILGVPTDRLKRLLKIK